MMLRIHVFNVGLGDSFVLETIIEGQSQYSIIDCASVGGKAPTVEFLKDREIRHIRSLFLTHPHLDHSSGIPLLIEYLEDVRGTMEFFVSPQLPQQLEVWRWIIEQLDEKKQRLTFKVIEAMKRISSLPSLDHPGETTQSVAACFEGDSSEYNWRPHFHPGVFLAPVNPRPEDAIKPLTSAIDESRHTPFDVNDISHAMLLRWNTGPFDIFGLFTGDLDSKKWRCVKNRCLALTKDTIKRRLRFLKWPHHGKYTDTIKDCLKQIIDPSTPFFVSISCPYGSRHHPSRQTLDFLKDEFTNSCVACTNLSTHCASLGIAASENFFIERSQSQQEFLELVSLRPHTELLADGTELCAGDHTITLANSGCSLSRSSGAVCQYLSCLDQIH
jgi:hypothetical protein